MKNNQKEIKTKPHELVHVILDRGASVSLSPKEFLKESYKKEYQNHSESGTVPHEQKIHEETLLRRFL